MMNKENLKKIAISVIIAIMIIAIFVLIRNAARKPIEPVYFTDEPESWIEDNPNSHNQQDMMVNVHRATKALSILDGERQEYYYYGKRVTFFSHGYYQGNYFTQGYVTPEVLESASQLPENEQLEYLERSNLIRISNNMNPDDGIINGFILAKVEGTEFVFYIYLDQDWRDEIGYTNILWADNLADIGSVNIRRFDFSNENGGIYVDKIEGVNWLEAGTNGGIFIGEIDRDTLEITSQKDLNSTFIYIQ